MKLLRMLLLALCLLAPTVGCGPRNVDKDPKADELDLKIEEGDSAKE